jgi:hypothetical protein
MGHALVSAGPGPALTEGMELRQLKALLAALRREGVTSFRDGDLAMTFGPQLADVPEGDVDGADTALLLPPGVPDPRAAIEQLYARDRKRRVKAKAA